MARAKKSPNVEPEPKALCDDALRLFVGYQMKRAFNVMKADLARVLEPSGLRMTTYSALVLIDSNPRIRQSELAQMLAMERPNMVLVLDDLEQGGWITRERVETDRRAYALMATLAGKRLCAKLKAANLKAEESRLQHLTSDERRSLTLALAGLEGRGD